MAPNRARARVAGSSRYGLGEGILLDPMTGLVQWIDINDGVALEGKVGQDGITETRRTHIDVTVGAVALAADGGRLFAAATGLACLSPDGVLSLGPDLVGDRPGARLNDGAVDPQGRFVVGTLTTGGRTDQEVLVRVSASGEVETLRTGLSLSNGIGFSPDGATIYHVDTLTKTLSAHAYDSQSWDAWTPIPCDFAGHPDGLIVDVQGHLWVAQWGAGLVQCFAPREFFSPRLRWAPLRSRA
ncbi:SMP-30/gluconolactonase/LRE family protein [Nakamurella antarctica]|uniref:SMP-30/gluconolactonase/LRE family protein n=1 Tax=Nakamurella antarctica TaxID=1902245 RepID=A0A3G8ZLF9_9ACTN|nr:SMP-30/gluconolactonase/LRE family protein [Nakamurella antarctica]AZI57988.1 SMP-30/gluconolactonase/LRE family protein [Nakamurella antarctica]